MSGGSRERGSGNSESGIACRQHALLTATTFVETDSHSFKEIVQKLTGVSDNLEGKSKKLPVTMAPRNSNKASRIRSDGNYSRLFKGGMEVGARKSSFKLQDRRQFMKKLEIDLALTSPVKPSSRILAGKVPYLSPTTRPSPITPLGPDPFTSSSSTYNYCSVYNYSSSSPSTPTSYNHFDNLSYMEKAEEEFCFQPSQQREPELLSLFPLHSTK